LVGVEVQSRPEPEVVLETIAQRPPTGLNVHQLDTGLHHVGAGFLEACLDEAQQPRMHVVLGVEHADDVATAFWQRGIQRLRLVLRHVVIHHDANVPPVARRGRTRDVFGFRVVVTDDHDHLVVGMVQPGQRVDRVTEHGLLVACRQQQRKRPVSARTASSETRGRQRVRTAPGVQHPPQRGRRDTEQAQRQDQEGVVEDALRQRHRPNAFVRQRLHLWLGVPRSCLYTVGSRQCTARASDRAIPVCLRIRRR
jgi:hypothetical protein